MATRELSLLRHLWKKARTAAVDLRYGGWLQGTRPTQFAHLGAKNTANTDYDALPYIFTPGTITPDDVLVDVGCGKGRVLNWWLSQGHRNRIVGLELDPDVAARTGRRLRRHRNVSVIAGDAVDNLPVDATVLYLFNPFQRQVVERLAARLTSLDSYRERRLRVFYYGPRHVDVFESDDRWGVEHRRLGSPWPHRQDLAVLTPR